MHSPNRAEDLTPPSLFQFVLSPQQRLCLCGGLKPIRIKVLKEPQIYKNLHPKQGLPLTHSEFPSTVGYCVQRAPIGLEELRD